MFKKPVLPEKPLVKIDVALKILNEVVLAVKGQVTEFALSQGVVDIAYHFGYTATELLALSDYYAAQGQDPKTGVRPR